MADDGLERIEALLGAISKITIGDEAAGLPDARCPKCQAADFIKVTDLYDEAVRRLDEQGSVGAPARDGGLTDAQIVEKFSPPAHRSSIGRVLVTAIPLAIVAGFVYRRFGAMPGQFAIGAAVVITFVVFLTTVRRLSDDYYDRRRQWRKLYLCRRCGQLVEA